MWTPVSSMRSSHTKLSVFAYQLIFLYTFSCKFKSIVLEGIVYSVHIATRNFVNYMSVNIIMYTFSCFLVSYMYWELCQLHECSVMFNSYVMSCL